MSRISRSNLPDQPLRWSVEKAAAEFGLTHPTLRKALAQNSIQADADGCFSTKEIASAVFGDLAGEKLLTQKQLTRKYTNENRITEGAYVDRAELDKLFAQVADAMKSRIEASDLDRTAQEDLLRELASVPVGVSGIVKRQSKLATVARANGDEDDSE
jgi:hypothetical protein